MKRLVLPVLIVAALAVAVIVYSFMKPTEEASGPIEAIPIQVEENTPGSAPPERIVEGPAPTPSEQAEAEPATAPAVVATDDAATDAEEAQVTTETTGAGAEATPEEEAAEEATPAEDSEPVIFEIDPSSSQARYIIDEVLRGAPTTVVGVTDQVAGQIAVDPSNPGETRLGTVLINARTFATDESRRDRAVQTMILSTNQYEFITFEPTSLVGLPESATVGESYTFQVLGHLTIRDTTAETTWDVTVTPVSTDRLEGTATTVVQRSTWGLNIPSVPFVANVSEEVRLELDFVAVAQ